MSSKKITKRYHLLSCYGYVWRLTDAAFKRYARTIAAGESPPDLDSWPGATYIAGEAIRDVTDVTQDQAKEWVEQLYHPNDGRAS